VTAPPPDVDDLAESYSYALTVGERVRAVEARLFGSPRSRWEYSPGGILDSPYGEYEEPAMRMPPLPAVSERRIRVPCALARRRSSAGLWLLLDVLIRRALKRMDGDPSREASHPGQDVRAKAPCRALVRAHAILTSGPPVSPAPIPAGVPTV
jgi:hypothetical protein